MNKDKLRLLGLANKAGFIISGEDAVVQAMQKKKIYAVIVANDASPKTIDKFVRKCYFYKVTCYLDLSSNDITQALGKPRKIVALTNQGFFETLEKMNEVKI